MAVVALHISRRSRFIGSEPDAANIPATRPIYEVESLDHARRFADQSAIDAFVSSRGGSTAAWVAMTLP